MAGDAFTWTDPSGAVTNLNNGTTLNVLTGGLGYFMPPAAYILEQVPLQPGARLRSVRHDVRELDLPLYMEAASESALRTQVRALMSAFDPTRGDGVLQCTAPDGAVRQLTCRYAHGFEGSEAEADRGVNWRQMVLSLRAVDPYWYAGSAVSQDFTAAQAGAFFPILPIRLSSSAIFADGSVVNPGDVEAWPQWTITGPGNTIHLRNLSTGEDLFFNATVPATEVLRIDTRPGKKTLITGSANVFGGLDSTSVLWSLRPGTTSIRIEIANATAATKATLAYTPRYLGP